MGLVMSRGLGRGGGLFMGGGRGFAHYWWCSWEGFGVC